MYSGRVWLECLIFGCRFFTARKFRSPAVLSIVWWCSWYTRPSLATMVQSNRFPATSLSLLLQHHFCIQLTVLRSLVSTAPAAFSATLMSLLLHSHQRSSTLLLTFVKLFCQTSLNHCFPAVKFLQAVLFELPRVFFSQQCLATLFWVLFSFFRRRRSHSFCTIETLSRVQHTLLPTLLSGRNVRVEALLEHSFNLFQLPVFIFFPMGE